MMNGFMPRSGRRQFDVQAAGAWLRRHGLGDGAPTPLLTARLAVRRRARLLASVLPAVLILGAALVQASDLLATSASGGDASHPPAKVLVLSVLIVGLLLARMMVDAWVRRVDRQTGESLARRAAHPTQLGWRALLGRPYAFLAAGTFGGAFALAGSALAVGEGTARHGAVVLLVAVAGVAAGSVLQLRDLLARPVVAEDEVSLTADVIMRIEDARESTMPAVLWSLPVVLLLGTAPGWWNAASIGFVLLGLGAYIAVHVRTPCAAAMARRVVGVR
ncbi:hypothetical protein GCM10023194_31590 [Planotetraspora phitsanulokensis]|uniref:Uncharacterized protein n=1 Tax=Planotetraspora phitsanulokensis TaxID=575192 RepID=A0A8J3XGM6_9ACTN|nr:hypothetical protein [Planotetraspora phitsanulokensis]GII35703.1 hypothetical protein Pph01_07060 [Planotetraspora phitsanulokensis]